MIGSALLARLWRRGQAQSLPEELARSTTRLGEAAQRLLDDPVLTLAFEALDDELLERWKTTKVSDYAGREMLYALHCALVETEAKLRDFVGDAARVAAEQARNEQRGSWAA